MNAAGALRATYREIDGSTKVERVREVGPLRLRHPRARSCEAVIVNTAGGVVAGDSLGIEIEVGSNAAVTITSAAAEKIYRSDGACATIATRLSLAPASRAAWMPQETILFDGARVRRRFEADLAEDSHLVMSEIVLFGRRASGERSMSGNFHDSWRLRRDGRMIFADETRLDGPISAILEKAAAAGGACACALVLFACPQASELLAPIRASIDAAAREASVEGYASLVAGITVARLIAHSGEHLRRAVADMLTRGGGIPVPRVWQ